MPRIQPITDNNLLPAVKAAFEKHITTYNARITNMKASLGHSLLAFNVYMEWYPLYMEISKIFGQRLASLFAYSISQASDCPLCSTFFRKIIIDAGEKPETLQLTSDEEELVRFGAAIAKQQGNIADDLYNRIAEKYTTEQMVNIIAFAGQMIATNVFNNVIETQIDDYLSGYKPDKNIHADL